MRFLADESCDFRVVRTFRAAGHDVVAVVAASAKDDAVIAMAMREGRIFLSEDRLISGSLSTRPTQGVIPHRTREPISRPWCRTLWRSMEKSSPHASLSSSREELGSTPPRD